MGNFASGGVNFDGTYAAAVAPNNSNVVYIFTVTGNIYVSANQGQTFTATGFTPVTITVNGANDNNFNNKLVIDPQNPAFVIAGCPSGTFYNTTSGSGSWTRISGVGTGTFASLIAFDPSSSVVSTFKQGIYVSTYGTGIYHFTGGPSGTFTLLNSAGMPTLGKQLKVAGDGTVYVVANDGTQNVYKYNGSAWSTLTPLPAFAGTLLIVDVVIDPANSSRVIATFDGGLISESTDHGATWSGVTPAPITRVTTDVPWLGTARHPSLAGGTSAFNPALTNTLMLTDGISAWTTTPTVLTSTSSYAVGATGNTTFAVSGTQNIPTISVGDPVNFIETASAANNGAGLVVSYTPATATTGTLVVNVTFSAGSGTHTDWIVRTGPHWTSQGTGINQLVNNQIVCPPGGRPFFTCWDRCGFYLASAASFPANQAFVNPGASGIEIIGGWDVDYSATTPTYLAGIFNSNISTFDTSGYSTDGGQTWTAFGSNTPWGSSQISGSIAVAANSTSTPSTQNIVWMPAGRGGGGNNPYYSTDGGATWSLCSFPVAVPTTGVTGWGTYNSFIKQVVADRVALNTFYAYNQGTTSVYKSIDSGHNWSKVNVTTPVSSTGIQIMRSVPKNGTTDTTGWLFGWDVNIASDVLQRSKDGGANWSTVDSTFTTVAAVGFGKTVNGAVPAILVVAIKSGVRGIYLSTDDCATWKNVTTSFNSADQIGDCDGDKNTSGIWYIATKNTGIYQGTAVS